ncbi:MAG TPA: YbhB/YbcL family Raf kinase inhibitor-like protein [Candidatus Saccharimonadales bacterium]|nr:YbhB/YbcL family Raf kinase inhibitor-like protein [Candidatus Saccharimonadales bacterium]HSX46748.1 YbhB/YbcL family Raf kinase inhibitor-like protein [Patescibacteria group bacterium]
MQLTSPDFEGGQPLPLTAGLKRENRRPSLRISDVPAGANNLAVLVYDPDAPNGNFTHWLAWNIPPATIELNSDNLPAGVVQGTNDLGNSRWDGPAPPGGTHHYHFVLLALSAPLNLPASASRKAFDQKVQTSTIEKVELVGLYSAD